MLTLENYETVALALAGTCALLFLTGLIVIKPSNSLAALPVRNRLGLILVMLGILLACLAALTIAVYRLQPLLVPT